LTTVSEKFKQLHDLLKPDYEAVELRARLREAHDAQALLEARLLAADMKVQALEREVEDKRKAGFRLTKGIKDAQAIIEPARQKGYSTILTDVSTFLRDALLDTNYQLERWPRYEADDLKVVKVCFDEAGTRSVEVVVHDCISEDMAKTIAGKLNGVG